MAGFEIDEPINVFGAPLAPCGTDPVTGFFRDGHCNTCSEDHGSHTVCVEVDEAFLQYTRFAGNDLSTPNPAAAFPGLKPGDRWCLCAGRWLQAYENGMAPKIFMHNTHQKALHIIPLALMTEYAATVN